MLRNLEQQHRRFLERVSEGTVRVLQEENRRLHDELSVQKLKQMKSVNFVSPQKLVSSQPAVPPLPSRLFTPPVAEVPRLRISSHANGPEGLYPQGGVEDVIMAWPEAARAPGSVLASNAVKPITGVTPCFAVSAASTAASRRVRNQMVQHKQKELKRFRYLLRMNHGDSIVSVARLHNALKERRPYCALTYEGAQDVIAELRCVQRSFLPDALLPQCEQELSLTAFVTLIFTEDLAKHVRPDMQEDVFALIKAMRRTTVEEVIEEATKGATEGEAVSIATVQGKSWEGPLNMVVSTVVIVNLLSMGFSIDNHPEHAAWILLEMVCTSVFLTEVALKLWHEGLQGYWLGENCHWNWMDSAITFLSVCEVSLSIATELEIFGDAADVEIAAQVAQTLRVLRAARVIRLVKLLRSPMMRDLASMLVGIVIGIPALFWVFVLFLLVLFVMGTFFRVVIGPTGEQDQISLCGPPDHYDGSDPECKLHYMYGEEFFGSVKRSMFTTFRFMIGDFSTGAGKSLAVIFSRGFGLMFEVAYCVGMISVMFGLFNIITAIFVDSTISGLKHNDVKRKHARQYERRFVKEKLQELLKRIAMLKATRDGNEVRSSRSSAVDRIFNAGARGSQVSVLLGQDMVETLQIDEEDFFEVMEDGMVKRLLEDLDVDMFNAADMFDTFDPNGQGYISVSSLVQAIMKLRGEPQKNDLIASWLSVRALHEKVDALQAAIDDRSAPAPTRECH